MPKNKIKRKRKTPPLGFFKSLILFFTVFISTFLILEFLFKDPFDETVSEKKSVREQNEKQSSPAEFTQDGEYGFAKIDESLFRIKEEDNTPTLPRQNDTNDTSAANETSDSFVPEEPDDFPEPDYSPE